MERYVPYLKHLPGDQIIAEQNDCFSNYNHTLKNDKHVQVDEIIQDETDIETCAAQPIPTIDPITIFIPCVALVFPPLIGSLCVLFCSKRQPRKQKSCAAVGDNESMSTTDNNSMV